MGDNHDRKDGPGSLRSPTARRAYVTAITIRPTPRAARADVVSCAQTAPMAPYTMPVAAQPIPKANEPAAGRPAAVLASPVSTPSSVLAPTTSSSAAVSGASRPSLPPLSSSIRPVSSSARVWRIITKSMTTPTIAAPTRARR